MIARVIIQVGRDDILRTTMRRWVVGLYVKLDVIILPLFWSSSITEITAAVLREISLMMEPLAPITRDT